MVINIKHHGRSAYQYQAGENGDFLDPWKCYKLHVCALTQLQHHMQGVHTNFMAACAYHPISVIKIEVSRLTLLVSNCQIVKLDLRLQCRNAGYVINYSTTT